jgi:hypothetical protein
VRYLARNLSYRSLSQLEHNNIYSPEVALNTKSRNEWMNVKIIKSLYFPWNLVAVTSWRHQTLVEMYVTLRSASVSWKTLCQILCFINIRKYVRGFQIVMQRTCAGLANFNCSSEAVDIPESSLGQSECDSSHGARLPDKGFYSFYKAFQAHIVIVPWNMSHHFEYEIHCPSIPRYMIPPASLPRCNRHYWARASSLSRLHDHRHTALGRTPLNEWSHRSRSSLPGSTTLARHRHRCPRRERYVVRLKRSSCCVVT